MAKSSADISPKARTPALRHVIVEGGAERADHHERCEVKMPGHPTKT